MFEPPEGGNKTRYLPDGSDPKLCVCGEYMSQSPQTLQERVAASFSQLNSAAADLNQASDQVGKYVFQIDTALKQLNLGISAWVHITHWEGDNQDEYAYGSQDLGYDKIDGKWSIGLRKVQGSHRNPEDDSIEKWSFNDAPRAARLAAIDVIPRLIEALSTEAVKITGKIKAKLADVQVVAEAMNPPKVMAYKDAVEALGKAK